MEALQQGCIAAASDIPVLREVLGDAALFFDPGSPASLVAAWESARQAGTRQRLVQAAPRVLANLSWSEVARRTREVYQRAAAS